MDISKSIVQSNNFYRSLDPLSVRILEILNKSPNADYTKLLTVSQDLAISFNRLKTRVSKLSSFGFISRSERAYKISLCNITDRGQTFIQNSDILEIRKVRLYNFSQFLFIKGMIGLDQFTKNDIRKITDLTDKTINNHIKSFIRKNILIFKEKQLKREIYEVSPLGKDCTKLISQFEIINQNRTNENFPKISSHLIRFMNYDFLLLYFMLHEIEKSKSGHGASTLNTLVREYLVIRPKVLRILRTAQSLKLIEIRKPDNTQDLLVSLTRRGLDFIISFEKL